MTTKRCASCHEDKDPSAFSKDASRKDGLRRVCRSCRSVQQKDWRRRNPRQAPRKVKPKVNQTVTYQPSVEVVAKAAALRDEIAYTFDLITGAPCEEHRRAFAEHGRQMFMRGAAELSAVLDPDNFSKNLSG